MTPNFDKMTKPELRAYLISHPDDKNAFQAFVDRYTSDAPSDTYGMAKSPEDVKIIEQLIRQKISDR